MATSKTALNEVEGPREDSVHFHLLEKVQNKYISILPPGLTRARPEYIEGMSGCAHLLEKRDIKTRSF